VLQLVVGDFDRVEIEFNLVGLERLQVTFLVEMDHCFGIRDLIGEFLHEANVVERIE
jgi:hypothetical protein